MANSSSSTGVGLPMVVFIIFLILKLVGVIGWSWWWVTSPLWISFGVWILAFLIAIIAAVVKSRRV